MQADLVKENNNTVEYVRNLFHYLTVLWSVSVPCITLKGSAAFEFLTRNE